MSVRYSNKKRKNVARSRVSRLLQTVSRYISRDKYRDASMNRDDTSYDTSIITRWRHTHESWVPPSDYTIVSPSWHH